MPCYACQITLVGNIVLHFPPLCVKFFFFLPSTVLPALRANSCIDFDRLMIELLDFHISFLSFTNAGFKGYGKNLLNRRLRITLLP